ncbi:MAG: bifunctional oligoribonuclease/PAP phosphatase NrnA [Nitrospirae bacterium]|nr:bifunctional oligoribonuclease/PAP phosphatase NrnA [Nitrospirota bacterium]
MKIPEALLAFLNRERKFFIATHINPEADALGSSIALSIALESLGKETIVYDKDSVPEIYRFLPGQERFTNSISNSIRRGGQISNLILVDCNDRERAGLENIEFPYSSVIDHHETAREFGDIKWIDPKAPAAGLMIFYLIRGLGAKMTEDIAINLYSAIAIDTGTFRYSNTTPEALRIGAELIESGADPSLISENLYETWTENRFRLLLKVLDTLEIIDNVAITSVTIEMFKETDTAAEDTENFTGFTRMLKTTKVAAFFSEIEKDYYKVSLRSKGKINVAVIASTFGGGGHRNAAGYKIRSGLQAAKDALLRAIKQM